jgi:redox-sensitive bicupin YhaK (pirin superfamily)
MRLPAHSRFVQAITKEHNAFVYPYEGQIEIGIADQSRSLASQMAGVLSGGDRIEIRTTEQPAAFLVLAGRPLREPVVQYGPFVMNTRDEIDQALSDYRNGQLV